MAHLAAAVIGVHAQAGSAPDAPVIYKADRLILRVDLGVVHIERQVIALQNARKGQSLFVRTDDGDIIVAVAAAAP